MFKLPIFGKKKLLLAFEYGVILSQLALEQKIELTPEHIERAEAMIENEFTSQSATFCATNLTPNLLTVFELDLSK